jgi:hypothetical protein
LDNYNAVNSVTFDHPVRNPPLMAIIVTNC